MLDYAANALKYWPPDQIKTLAAEKFGSLEALETTLQNFLGRDESSDQSQDLEAYWATVEQNLRNGQVRLLFVADEIPAELRSIIEFLNEHMPMVEVLGVEIRQYQNQGIQARSHESSDRQNMPDSKKELREGHRRKPQKRIFSLPVLNIHGGSLNDFFLRLRIATSLCTGVQKGSVSAGQ